MTISTAGQSGGAQETTLQDVLTGLSDILAELSTKLDSGGTVVATDGGGSLTVDGAVSVTQGGNTAAVTADGNILAQLRNGTNTITSSATNTDAIATTGSSNRLSVLSHAVAFNGSTYDRLRSGAPAAADTGKLNVLAGSAPQTSLAAVTTTGAGTSIDLGATYKSTTVHVVIAGTPTAAVVVLEGSLDGTNWFTLAAATYSSSASFAAFSANQPVRYVRANCTTYNVAGGSVTARIAAA